MKKKIALWVAAILLAWVVYYLFIPRRALVWEREDPSRERLLERVRAYAVHVVESEWGSAWEMEDRRQQDFRSKLRALLDEMGGEPPTACDIYRIDMHDGRADVFLVWSHKDDWGSAIPDAYIWVYEDNDWYVGPAAWELDWKWQGEWRDTAFSSELGKSAIRVRRHGDPPPFVPPVTPQDPEGRAVDSVGWPSPQTSKDPTPAPRPD